jgi:hypothetical protein
MIAMAACGDAFRSGQANVIFAALVLLTACHLIERRWWAAAVTVFLGMAVKPLGIALAALIFVGYRQMMRPLSVSFVCFAVFPFFFAPTGYVLEQLQAAWSNLVNCSLVTQHRFADINGILRSLDWELSGMTNQVIRVVAGAATAGVWILLSRQPGRVPREFTLLALSTAYLMLFNPMTEVNSYIIMAPGYAVMGMYLLERSDGRLNGIALLSGVLSIGILPELMRQMISRFGLWWDPLATVGCLAGIVWYAYASGQRELQPTMTGLVGDLQLTKDRIRV